MKQTSILKRLLCMVLVLALTAGNVLPVYAADRHHTHGESHVHTAEPVQDGSVPVEFTQVDNDSVTAGPTPNGKTEVGTEGAYADTDTVRVSVILNKKSTIDAGYATMDITGNQAAIQYREGLKLEQKNMIQQIETAIHSDLDVVWNLTLAANMISVNVEYGQIKTIEKLPGVKAVVIENQYMACQTEEGTVAPNMATSGAQIGTAPVWAEGYTGAGMRIAVIDTGIDTNHQSLNAMAFEYSLAQLAEQKGMTKEAYIASLDLLDAEEIAKVAKDLNVTIDANSAYVSSKIAFAYNYRDFDYDVTHDNDEEGDHGSHVAGIATANSWLVSSDGATYGKALDYAFMQGVAPDAQLLALKVFGKNGAPYDSDFFAAIEDAIVLGADAINLSLGSTAPGRGHHTNPQFQQIMESLTKSGVVVSISAGNSGSWVENAENGGYLYTTDVSMDTVGQPGAFTNSLCVASVENDGMVGYYFTVGEETIVYIEELFNDMKSLTTLAGEQEYIFIDGVGKEEDWAAVADVLPGKVAICSRGETNFTEKARLAVEAGAIAVMIYNNASGIIYLDMTEFAGTAPVVSLTKVQGAMIRELSTPVYGQDGQLRYLTGKMNISKTIGKGEFGSEYYTMSDFSSWGVPGSLEMKPEITAPGGNIFSLEGLDPSGGAYAIKSGTSMAAPQVAGMAALMMQYIQENKLAEKTGMDERHLAQSLLMSTAKPILAGENRYFSILQQGAGLANIEAAVNADSYIVMDESASSGAADGKVKVELFDDPDKVGAYSATFTLNNLQDVDKTIALNADFFVQSVLSDGEHLYMDTATSLVGMDIAWYVNGKAVLPAKLEGMDFDGDGQVSANDGQKLLDYATGLTKELSNKDKADVDGDGDIDSHDAYVFLRDLVGIDTTLPANGSIEVRVNFALPTALKQELEETYPNGTYIQGFLYAKTESTEEGVLGTEHSIPVLGFYGNWTDPDMFDVGSWPTFDTGEDTRIPYTGILRGNEFQVRYAKDPNYHYTLGGNPVITDDVYMPERNSINASNFFHGIRFTPIRHADQSRIVVTNKTTGAVMFDQKTGAVNMAYYPNEIYGWQNAMMSLETNLNLKNTNEGDVISVAFTLVPEYYIDEEGNVDWDALGTGATRSMDLVIDNTAPVLKGVSIDLLNNTMTITASDNEYIAAAGLYNKTGTRSLAAVGAKQDIEKGETAEYTFSLEGINGKKFLVQVHDYAMNAATYLIEMQIGENVGVPDMMAFDLVARHWTTFTKDFVYDYKVGTPRLEYSDFTFYAATIAEHFVFASTNTGELYVMPEDDLSDTTFVVDMGVILYDMAYNKADGNIYGITEANNLVVIDKLTGELTKVAAMPKKTNTLACSPEGVFYFNELATGKVYSFTLDTINNPTLLMEDPFLTREDPIYGDHEGTTGNMGMEYDPNRNMICWNSHLEVLIGSYITFAYYYEIDPATGEFTRYNDFWHEMSCLMIPDETGRNDSWAEPTDQVSGVAVNKSYVEVIKGTSTKLMGNVQPWTATDRSVIWSSANNAIATVDQNGVITGVAPGTTTITATSKLDPTKSASCQVNVKLLHVTVNGTVTDADNNTTFYSWNMAEDETWKPGKTLPQVYTSVTYSNGQNVYYAMDITDALQMHKLDADGKLLASAANENGIPLWDMAYSETFSTQDAEKVTSIYYSYLLSAKDPMALDAVGFDLGSMCSYLLGITTFGSETVEDMDGNSHDTEHLVMLDNDGYIWHFWVYAREGGGFDALYSINKSDLSLELPGYDSMEHMFTSLMAGEDGNLYLSAFTGETNELYYISYDEAEEQYLAVKIGQMGEDTWPATITSVTVNGDNTTTATGPKPMAVMSATEISQEELKAASTRVGYSVTAYERTVKNSIRFQVGTHATGTKTDPIPLVEGENSGTAPKSGSDKYCYFTFTATSAGTVTIESEGTDWRAAVYITGSDGTTKENGTQIHNPKYDGSTITRELETGDVFLLKISPYVSYMYGGDITVDFHFSGAGGTTPEPSCQHANTKVEGAKVATCTESGHTGKTVCIDCGETVDEGEPIAATGHSYKDGVCENCGEADPNVGQTEDTLVLGSNTLTSGKTYTYTPTADGRLEFDFTSIKDSTNTAVYQYAYGKGTRVKILINGNYVANLLDTKVTVTKDSTVTVELVSVDEDTYTAELTLATAEPATMLALGDNKLSRDADYSFIATKDGTLYTTIKELWCDDVYCSEASMTSSVVFRINGVVVTQFRNSYEVKTGDEITVLLGTSFDVSASAILNLSYEGFYEHPAGSRGNPYTLSYAQCPTNSVEIPAGTAVWYKLSGFGADAYLTVEGTNAYVIVGNSRVNAVNGKVTVPAASYLQVGNAGGEAATFRFSATITEGTVGNPQDLTEGDNKTVLDASANYYYDFVAKKPGTATVTVSGDNWRFWLSHLDASGAYLIQEEDHRAARGDAATVQVKLAVGESIVVKVGTMTASWTSPGGEVNVNFLFTPEGGSETCEHVAGTPVTENQVAPTCTASGSYDTVTYCTKCGEELSRVTTTVDATGHNPGAEATCTTAQLCKTCSAVIQAALGHNFVEGECSRCGQLESENALVLGENALTSGNVYTYTVPEDGRLEFDFTALKDSSGSQIYQYTYGKGTRAKFLINGNYVVNLENTRVTVTKGSTVTVELVSVDGGNYTATLTLSETEPATQLALGDNNMVMKKDYSFIATKDGTLYTTIKELWYDGIYCTEASLASSVVFKINGTVVYSFRNAVEVKTGDEVTFTVNPSFNESTSAILNLSYDGYYEHPAGSRGNPYILNYADCPTNSVEIPAGTAVWYRLSGFGGDAQLTVTGANAYVIIGNKQYDATNGSVTVAASTNLQIGNAGTTAASFGLSAFIKEGTSGNPKDLTEGKQSVDLPERGNYYYDYTATVAGTATFTVSGDNWGYQYTVYGADGAAISQSDMLYQYKGNAATAEVPLSAGQTVVIKLGTMNSSWSQPGGEVSVDFYFTADGSAPCTHKNEAGKWEYNDTHHWQICDLCEAEFNKGTHSYANGECATCGKVDPTEACEHEYGAWDDGKKVCSKCGKTVICQHPATTVKDQKAPTCTEEGYSGDTYCTVCGTQTKTGQVLPATGHDYVEGICTGCGESDPDYRPIISKEITHEVDATNGVVTITWDTAKMELVAYEINADYTSVRQDAGSITIGYVSLEGIPAGEAVVTLYFSVVDPEDSDINVTHKQINNNGVATCDCLANAGKPVVENTNPASCTEPGSYDSVVYCTKCGELISRETKSIDATGHSFTNYVSDNNATKDADGTKTALCDNGCGAKDTVTDVGSKLSPSAITSDIYTVTGNFISKLPAGTVASELIDGIHQKQYIKVFKGDEEVSGDTVVGTGMVVKLMEGDKVLASVTVVVTGDTNGDGNVNITDLLAVKAHILAKKTLEGAALQAADTSNDGSVAVTDFIQIKASILGKGTITPN